MANKHRTVSLGFTPKKVPEGTHMCLVFTNKQERISSLLAFLLSGLTNNERGTCFSSNITEDELRTFFSENNISYDERKQSGAISLTGTKEVYFEDGTFNPERMLNNIVNFYKTSKNQGYKSSRIIGEMIPEIENVPGGERLMEYECRVSMLLRDNPVTTVCLYDANEFDGATIMDVLKVHPKMIVNGAVVNNPFFIEPEVYLKNMAT